jgi:hypothetical protein
MRTHQLGNSTATQLVNAKAVKQMLKRTVKHQLLKAEAVQQQPMPRAVKQAREGTAPPKRTVMAQLLSVRPIIAEPPLRTTIGWAELAGWDRIRI